MPHDARERLYREPFLGGGAMYLHLQPHRAVLSASLVDLVTTYQVVQHSVDALVQRLAALRATHSTEQFYAIRDAFNGQRDAPRIERAAWLIYLNKTCYNGLFRTNQSGAFNVPIGRFATTPQIVDPPALRLAAAALAGAEIKRAHFEHLLSEAEPGDVIYFDPPYVPLSKTSSFSSYADGVFTLDDQARLAGVFRELDARGCLLALSNSDTAEVRDLYKGFDLSPIIASRAISAKASTRGDVTELLIRNVRKYPGRKRDPPPRRGPEAGALAEAGPPRRREGRPSQQGEPSAFSRDPSAPREGASAFPGELTALRGDPPRDAGSPVDVAGRSRRAENDRASAWRGEPSTFRGDPSAKRREPSASRGGPSGERRTGSPHRGGLRLVAREPLLASRGTPSPRRGRPLPHRAGRPLRRVSSRSRRAAIPPALRGALPALRGALPALRGAPPHVARWPLRATRHPLRATRCPLRATRHPLRATRCPLRATRGSGLICPRGGS